MKVMDDKSEIEHAPDEKVEIGIRNGGTKAKNDEVETIGFLKLMGTEMVDLTVGPEKKLFRVYRKLLCDKIPYFTKMFSTGFKEALEGTADFPEDDAETFSLLISWIYFQRLPELVTPLDKLQWRWDPLKLYGLAEKMCITELMDRVMDNLYDMHTETYTFFNLSAIDEAYRHAADGSALRRLASHSFQYGLLQGLEKWTEEAIQRVIGKHPDLAKDLMPLLRGKIGVFPKIPHEEFKKCDLHQHGKGEICPYAL